MVVTDHPSGACDENPIAKCAGRTSQGKSIMSKDEEYEVRSVHCEHKASQATREDMRAGYARIAHVWAGLARNVELRQKYYNSMAQTNSATKPNSRRDGA